MQTSERIIEAPSEGKETSIEENMDEWRKDPYYFENGQKD